MFKIQTNKAIAVVRNLVKWTNTYRTIINNGRITTMMRAQAQAAQQIEPTQQLQQQQQQQSLALEIEQLKGRTLLKINGHDVDQYLQSLITNDLSYIQGSNNNGSLYTMFLNDHGRLIADGILYRTSHSQMKNAYLLDIDKPALDIVQEHLNKYIKSNSSIRVTALGTQFNVWQIFNSYAVNVGRSTPNELEIIQTNVGVCRKQKWFNNDLHNLMMVYSDPRSSQLGLRVIASNDIDLHKIKRQLNIKQQQYEHEHEHNKQLTTYKQLRYKLGIGEGIAELPPFQCNPLELNGDYLNGIHFNKGDYVGSDITYQFYLNGFIYYRMIPIIFNNGGDHIITEEFNINDPIIIEQQPTQVNIKNRKGFKSTRGDNDQQIVGALRGVDDESGIGIALLRTDYINCDDMRVKNVKIKAPKPDWWPVMLSNEMPEELWTAALRS